MVWATLLPAIQLERKLAMDAKASTPYTQSCDPDLPGAERAVFRLREHGQLHNLQPTRHSLSTSWMFGMGSRPASPLKWHWGEGGGVGGGVEGGGVEGGQGGKEGEGGRRV